MTSAAEKRCPKIRAISFFFKNKNYPKNCPIGEKLPNLVTLP
jgi:hypothetical protein